jgi:Ribbon-helix-helix protein, copG family.
MARPRLYKKTVVVSVSMDKSLADALTRIAQERGISRSQLVSEILFQYVSQYYKDAESNGEARSEMEKYITRELSSIKSLVQSLIRYCNNTVCVKETMNKYGEAIINKLATLEDLAIKYKVTTAIPEIEKIRQTINSYK